jgi:AcrR family transcriptional regulator
LFDLTDRTAERARRRPEEKRARLLSAARRTFAQVGYGASVHEICRAAGIGIGTFYHQFPDKAELMRHLMDEEHDFRVRKFDALGGTNDHVAADVVRVLSGSDPALLHAMIDACGAETELRDHGRTLRLETAAHLEAVFDRIRRARDRRRPAIDAKTAAWVSLSLGDSKLEGDAVTAATQVIDVLAFAETSEGRIAV